MDLIAAYRVKDSQVLVSGVNLEVDLMVVHMIVYDVVGMDWLVENYSSIDFYKKEVIFMTPSKTSFKFKGMSLGIMPKVISMMKAKKLVQHEAWVVLASVMDTKKEETPLATVSVANKFSDVFPEDLSGIPPSRDVNFGIELEPSML